MHSLARNAVAIAAAGIIPLIAIPTQAQAATHEVVRPFTFDCPSSGEITPGDMCSSLTNGELLINSGSTEDHIEYDKDAGSSTSAKLGYELNGTNHYQSSYETMTAGGIYQWFPTFSSTCNSMRGLLLTSAGDSYNTPPADPC